MNKNNAKALSTLRQKIRKYNRDYETEIAAYKEVNWGSFMIEVGDRKLLQRVTWFCMWW